MPNIQYLLVVVLINTIYLYIVILYIYSTTNLIINAIYKYIVFIRPVVGYTASVNAMTNKYIMKFILNNIKTSDIAKNLIKTYR